jgi:hypothetical protein
MSLKKAFIYSLIASFILVELMREICYFAWVFSYFGVASYVTKYYTVSKLAANL